MKVQLQYGDGYGDCVVTSLLTVLARGRGHLVSAQVRVDGRTFRHVWAEVDGQAHEHSRGNVFSCDAAEFRAMLRACKLRMLSHDDAVRLFPPEALLDLKAVLARSCSPESLTTRGQAIVGIMQSLERRLLRPSIRRR